ncbi:cytochrome-c peroxidase [Nitrosomonas sp. Nm33]|uniref:cytochrome-c peroxidase n=1 Tax=Nitrosomonas sp. Nm33 TaxID=133724 RepID=UPI001C4090A1|nr:cytochrome-c peroxidase [Nitrosomonas sp. Nm33]
MTHVFADQSKLSIEQIRNLPIMQSLGHKIFFDTNLSNPPGQACSSCHDPKTAFSDPDLDLPVSRGAVEGKTGTINAPIVMYTAFIPAFHFDSEESLFIGGQFLDGRETTLEEQAKKPFLNPDEMNNPDKASVIEKIRNASYAAEFKLVFGQDALDDVDKAYDYVASALASFERSAILSPFTSKYDYYLAGAVKLSEQEERGLQLFEAKDKGNCAACHPSRPIDGRPPLFTDFTYDNLGIPSNQKLLEAKGADFVDIGLGKTAKDDTDNGKFRVPTLRNIAKTAPYMHNGVFTSLREAVDFYNTRDIDGKWPKPEIAATMNTEELGNLGLSDQEVDDIVAFMRTLSDGYESGEHAKIESAGAINLPYVRIEGQDVASKIYSVRMEQITAEQNSPLYHVTQLKELSLADDVYLNDIPYYSLDTGILEIPAIKKEHENGKQSTYVAQFKQTTPNGNLVFELGYYKEWQ